MRGPIAALRWLGRMLVAGVLLLVHRRRPDREERRLPASPRFELGVAALLCASGLASVAAIVVYALGADTQALGVSLGVALALIAAALILAASEVVVQEEHVEERPEFSWPDADRRGAGDADRRREQVETTAREVAAAGEGITRRRLLIAAGGTAGTALGASLVVPLASLAPKVDSDFVHLPWADGVRLVDEEHRRIRAADIEVGAFATAFAEGAGHANEGAVVVVVHVDPATLELPEDRSSWAPDGFLAFSKICTHAGCAVGLYRSPLYPPRSPGPALVCPCHYSTFDVLRAGEVVFGPAGRPLPQLPLRIEAGELVASGNLSGRVGPAWSGVREGPA